MKLKIKYFKDAKRLEKIAKGNWVDVYANEDIFIIQNGYAVVHLGFALELPKGYEGHLAPRSSTFKNWGVIQTNSVGIVDDTYIGNDDEWGMPLYCLEPKDTIGELKGTWIRKGDKIGQFRIMEVMPELEFEEVEKLEAPNRRGFGSTGKR